MDKQTDRSDRKKYSLKSPYRIWTSTEHLWRRRWCSRINSLTTMNRQHIPERLCGVVSCRLVSAWLWHGCLQCYGLWIHRHTPIPNVKPKKRLWCWWHWSDTIRSPCMIPCDMFASHYLYSNLRLRGSYVLLETIRTFLWWRRKVNIYVMFSVKWVVQK